MAESRPITNTASGEFVSGDVQLPPELQAQQTLEQQSQESAAAATANRTNRRQFVYSCRQCVDDSFKRI